jgi:hypothetical protein
MLEFILLIGFMHIYVLLFRYPCYGMVFVINAPVVVVF